MQTAVSDIVGIIVGAKQVEHSKRPNKIRRMHSGFFSSLSVAYKVLYAQRLLTKQKHIE